jgi:hypothetical protein
MCIECISYKNLIPHQLSFSQDASILTIGFGNVLTAWDAITFKLRCTLSAPPCLDGSSNNMTLVLSTRDSTITEEEKRKKVKSLVESHKKAIENVKSIMAGEAGEVLLKKLTCEKLRNFEKDLVNYERPSNLTVEEKELIFKKIFSTNELTFKKKIQLLHKLNVACKISENMQEEIQDYIKKNFNVLPISQTKSIDDAEKFKIIWKIKNYLDGNNRYCGKYPLKKIVRFPQPAVQDVNGIKEKKKKLKKVTNNNVEISEPKQAFCGLANEITNVLFCTHEYSHLVIVTTRNRFLIWNMLTLKLQASYKLSVKHITIDPIANLIAAFTKNNECEF